jgi:hypothetical protein
VSASTKVTSFDVGHPAPDDEQSRKKRKREKAEREKAGTSGDVGEKPDKSAAHAEADDAPR